MNIHSYEADATYERIFYEQRLDYMSISSRSGRAIAHDEEPAPSSHSNGSETHTAGSAHRAHIRAISFQERSPAKGCRRGCNGDGGALASAGQLDYHR